MNANKARDFEAKSKTMVDELGGLFKAGELKLTPGLITENTILVLLKSREVYRGPKEIIGYWKKQKDRGLVDIRFSIKKNILMPVDVLMRDRPDGGAYVVYDMANHLFGTYELVFRAKPERVSGDCYFSLLHLHACPRENSLMVFEGI
jgi:hypothetical protein